jgi:hypothetical protein
MNNQLIGRNKNNVDVYVFYQICPECKEPIIGVREKRHDEWVVLSTDVEGVTLLKK